MLRRLFGELDVQVRPTEMSMSIRCEATGSSTPAAAGSGCVAQPAPAARPAVPADAGCRSSGSTAGPRPSSADHRRRRPPDLRRVPRRREGFREPLRRALRRAASSPACGRAGRGDGAASTPPATCSGSSTTTACSGRRVAAVVHRRRRLAHLRRAHSPRCSTVRPRRSPVTAVPRTRDGVEVAAPARARRRATTASSSPPTPTRRSACWPTRPTAERQHPRARSATRRTRPCCTPTARLLPRARRARASWNYR